jgi:hypothetical protein
LLAGCSNDQSAESITKEQTIPLSLSATSLSTKASDPALPSGISAGVYVTAANTAISSAYFLNYKYTSDGSGVLSTDTNADLTLGSSYDIYAYAPYQSVISTPDAVEYPHGTDVLWSSKATISNVSKSNNTAVLAFEHRAAQVSFNVAFDKDFNVGSKEFTSSSTIEVSGFYSKGILNISTGALTPVGTTDYSLKAVATGTAGSMTLGIGETCFIPSSGEMTFLVKVTHEGKIYNATIKGTFAAGSSTNYTVSVLKSYSTLGISFKIQAWTPVSESAEIR